MTNPGAKPGSRLGVTGFHHFSVTVSDVERSIRFYRDILGMEVFWSKAGGGPTPIREENKSYVAGVTGYDNAHLKIALVRSGSAILELIEYIAPRGEPIPPSTCNPGSPHIAFTVADLDHAWQTLQDAADEWGLTFASAAPITLDKGANIGGRAVYFRDADGITIELIELNSGWTREEV